MRFFLGTFLVMALNSTTAHADSWYGFCSVEKNNVTVCSAPEPRIGDFSPICDLFARIENANSWHAQFSTSLEHLQVLMERRCDVVRGGIDASFFACQIATLCPTDSQSSTKHLASKVYSKNSQEAMNDCFEKEQWQYKRELLKQSTLGCFVSILVEPL